MEGGKNGEQTLEKGESRGGKGLQSYLEESYCFLDESPTRIGEEVVEIEGFGERSVEATVWGCLTPGGSGAPFYPKLDPRIGSSGQWTGSAGVGGRPRFDQVPSEVLVHEPELPVGGSERRFPSRKCRSKDRNYRLEGVNRLPSRNFWYLDR